MKTAPDLEPNVNSRITWNKTNDEFLTKRDPDNFDHWSGGRCLSKMGTSC